MQAKSASGSIASILGGTKKVVENEFIDYAKLSALVIDDIGAMRHAIRSQLQWMGMNLIKCVGSAEEALHQIQVSQFDVILCDYNLNRSSSGQHFLEYLRTENLLSAQTVFIMMTAEAEYAYVANAVEYSPDDYILKPCPEVKLRARLERLLDRRNFLKPALNAMDEKDYACVCSECDRLIALVSNERWVLAALRLKADAQLKLNDINSLLKTYQWAQSISNTTPWVKIGIARAYLHIENFEAAEQAAQEIIESNPNYVAAYELMSDIKRIQQDEESAYQLTVKTSEILPSTKRFRSASESAFLLGKFEDAKKYSESAIKLSNGSLTERSDDFLSLALIQNDMGDPKGAIATLEKSARKYEEKGAFGISKNAVLAQAYFDDGDEATAKKLLVRAQRLITEQSGSDAMTMIGKAAFKLGDEILGLKMMTHAVQSSGNERNRVSRHVTKSMIDTGQKDKVADVLDAGQRRILALIDEAQKAMRAAQFDDAFQKIFDALAIHSENIEALLAAAQVHLLWLKQKGMDKKVEERAKGYLATLDRLVPQNEKVMGFYRFYSQLTGA